ncbi:MAG: divergent polysaccharide deacetylase family protein [bacterium]
MSGWDEKYRKYSFILYALIICFIFLFVIKIITESHPEKTINSYINTKKEKECSAEFLKQILKATLDSYDVEYTLYPLSNGSQEWYLRVPSDLPIPSIHLTLKQSFKEIGAHIVTGNSEPVSGRLSLAIQYDDSCFLKVYILHKKEKGWGEGVIALIIDDFGYHFNSTIKDFFSISAELSYSVIPGTRFSSEIAEEIKRHNYELILHLPMEPIKQQYQRDEMIILSNMNQYQIRSIIQSALNNVSGVVGMNNHMGSKITENRELMKIILKNIKQKDLFYIDSRTSSRSIAFDVARELNIPTAKRDIFIDNEESKASIKAKLWDLAELAKKRGYAIGIGHCSRLTLEVLQTEISEIQKKGFRFVKVSKVVQ